MNNTQRTTGVHDTPPEIDELDFRRDALLFDVVAVPMLGWQIRNLKFHLEHHEDHDASTKVTELEWLIDKGIIYEPPAYEKYPSPRIVEQQKKTDILHEKFMQAYAEYLKSKDQKWLEQAKHNQWDMCDIHSRLIAAELRKYTKTQAYPILYSSTSFDSLPGTSTTVMQIVFENIPQPVPFTPWERILDYRQDPETQYRLSGLRTWASQVARGELTASEIRDKLAWELETYQRHIAAHELAVGTDKFEIILTTAGDILEELVRLEFGKAVKTIFALRKKKLELIMAEIDAPGRELAYIYQTQKLFGEKK